MSSCAGAGVAHVACVAALNGRSSRRSFAWPSPATAVTLRATPGELSAPGADPADVVTVDLNVSAVLD